MKLIKYAVAAALALAWGNAFAFHSGGVAECEGCHSMHNSYEGSANVGAEGGGTWRAYGTGSGPYLLKANDQSGACLNCHENAAPGSYHISTPGLARDQQTPYTTWVGLTPGGDFGWLKKTMSVTIRGTVGLNEGDRHGHNIIATDYGYTADKTLTKAPGGSYPADKLACSSCHDPHGKYRRFAGSNAQSTTGLPIFNSGSYTSSKDPIAGVAAVGVYRILGGVGYQPKSVVGSFAFGAPAPDAVAKGTYNAAGSDKAGVQLVNTAVSGGAQIDLVAYGQGMSEWCANCHTAMLENAYQSGVAGHVHPAGNSAKLTGPIAANYAAYVSSGIMTGATTMSALAPAELGITDYAQLKAFPANPTAPGTGANVLCLSCHRAHASGFESMARYSLTNEFMTIADAAGAALYDNSTTENKVNFGYSDVTMQQAAYNGRPATAFGPYARNYCNKCHAKD